VRLAAYPLPLVEAMLAFAGPGIRRALLDGRALQPREEVMPHSQQNTPSREQHNTEPPSFEAGAQCTSLYNADSSELSETDRIWRNIRAAWAEHDAATRAIPERHNPLIREITLYDLFEAWLVERWLKEIRSDEFAASAEGQYLIAEWERGR
jgi:hypothetical protein